MSIDELQSFLLVQEKKLSQQDKKEQVLQEKTNLEGASWENNGSKGKNKHHKSREGNKHNSQATIKGSKGHNFAKNKSKVQCLYCHKYKHYHSKCHTNLSKNRDEHSEKSEFTEKKKFLFLWCPIYKRKIVRIYGT